MADFDAATIATTHGFCQEVLAELGTIGDLDRETEFVEDVSDLLEQTLDDLYVRRFGPAHAAEPRGSPARRRCRSRGPRWTTRWPTLEPRGRARGTALAAMRYRLADAGAA